MNIQGWRIEETEFLRENIEINGSRFLIGNGYMGYRGTLEEFGKEQLVSLNMAGLFDQNGDNWRESVNAPNPFYVKVTANGTELSALSSDIASHSQILDISCGLHTRKTGFYVGDVKITVTAERFLSLANEHIAAIRYKISSDKDAEISVITKPDTDVWNIGGEHFRVLGEELNEGIKTLNIQTLETKTPMHVLEYINSNKGLTAFNITADSEVVFEKITGIYWGDSCKDAKDNFDAAITKGFNVLLEDHKACWARFWDTADVVIEGDDEAQFALRYSTYHLNSIVPRNTDKCGIPARGLSGQVYKGAAFWDTEMFMMPFFSFTDKKLCENLVKYRINTLEGAKRKAKEFGFEGAFYAWECQETGDDACSLFNITDIITNRPLRTHFKDGQIHISADMVYGLWNYCTVSGDYSVLGEGGLQMIYECLYFYYSHAAFKPLKNRFELHSVVGPDEYHEQVNNNAFTNKMVCCTAEIFRKAIEFVKQNMNDKYQEFTAKNDISWVDGFAEKLYMPQPNSEGVIEQFDGYFGLEDLSLSELKKRIIMPNEYLGGGAGLATTTRIIKQADVIMMLNVFRNEYSKEIKKANWEFYEPYTEHGSSLSACAYGIVAAQIGKSDWAYKYFMKTATVDLTGDSKQYVGSLYIGGTHPAANGGSWNTAIFGFGGVSYTDDTLDISPSLPEKWSKLSFKLNWKGVPLTIIVTKSGVTVEAAGDVSGINVTVNKEKYML